MNYQRIYDSLITRAQSRSDDFGYFERHHILPKCLGGNDEPSNIVKLTAEEHYLVHLLLVKMHPGNGSLIFAAKMMTVSCDNFANRPKNKLYSWLKQKANKEIAKLLSDGRRKGKNHPGWGKKRIGEALENIRAAAKTRSSPKPFKKTVEGKLKHSIATKRAYDNGYVNPNKGIKWSEEAKRKNSLGVRVSYQKRRFMGLEGLLYG